MHVYKHKYIESITTLLECLPVCFLHSQISVFYFLLLPTLRPELESRRLIKKLTAELIITRLDSKVIFILSTLQGEVRFYSNKRDFPKECDAGNVIHLRSTLQASVLSTGGRHLVTIPRWCWRSEPEGQEGKAELLPASRYRRQLPEDTEKVRKHNLIRSEQHGEEHIISASAMLLKKTDKKSNDT